MHIGLVVVVGAVLAAGAATAAGDDAGGGGLGAGPAEVRAALESAKALEEARRWGEADAAYAKAASRAAALRLPAGETAALHGRARCLEPRLDWPRLRQVYARLRDLARDSNDRVGSFSALANLAVARMSMGDARGAEPEIAEAISGFEALHDDANLMNALCTSASIRGVLGAYARAGADAERAVGLARASGGASDRAYASQTLARVFLEVGAYDRAATAYRAALPDFGPEDEVFRGDTLGNLGFALYWGLGDPVGALEALEQARLVYAGLGERESTSLVLLHIAEVRRLQGEFDAAERTIAEAREAMGKDGRYAADADKSLADVLVERPRPDAGRAIALYESALARNLEIGNLDQQIDCRRGLAQARLVAGDLAGAVAESRRGMVALDALGAGLPDAQGGGARAHRSKVYEVGIRAAVAQDDAAVIAEFLERSRAGALVETLGGGEALRGAGLSPALAKRESDAREALVVAEIAFQVAVADGAKDVVVAKRMAREAAQSAFLAAEDAIQRDARLAAGVSHPYHADLAELEGALEPGDVMVLYSLLPDRAGALVVGPRPARWADLGPSKDVVAACVAADVGRSDDLEEARNALRALGNLAIRPLDIPKGTKRLLLSPDGVLCTAPLPLCLRGRDDVPDVVDVAMVPSGTVYRMLRAERARTGKGVLALADPDYGVAPEAAAQGLYGRGRAFHRLAESRAEVARFAGKDDVPLLGGDATEARVRGAAAAKQGRWSAIHLACHGLLNLESPLLSSLAVTAGKDDDGYLTGAEIVRLRLPADLVVLSACDTARGRVVRGEGMYGLARAFMCAGAPRVVAGLWKVDDRAARELMTRFHDAWREPGVSTARALRRAQDRVAALGPLWAHPKHWGAWVVWGLPD